MELIIEMSTDSVDPPILCNNVGQETVLMTRIAKIEMNTFIFILKQYTSDSDAHSAKYTAF